MTHKAQHNDIYCVDQTWSRESQLYSPIPRHHRSLRSMIDTMAGAVAIINTNYEIVFCNERFVRLFGYPSWEEIVGTNVLSLRFPMDTRVRSEYPMYTVGAALSSAYTRPEKFEPLIGHLGSWSVVVLPAKIARTDFRMMVIHTELESHSEMNADMAYVNDIEFETASILKDLQTIQQSASGDQAHHAAEIAEMVKQMQSSVLLHKEWNGSSGSAAPMHHETISTVYLLTSVMNDCIRSAHKPVRMMLDKSAEDSYIICDKNLLSTALSHLLTFVVAESQENSLISMVSESVPHGSLLYFTFIAQDTERFHTMIDDSLVYGYLTSHMLSLETARMIIERRFQGKMHIQPGAKFSTISILLRDQVSVEEYEHTRAA